MRLREGQSLRVAVVARSVYPVHRFGGLERHVYDLVRCLLARDVQITLVTPPAAANRPADASADAVFRHPNFTMLPVPYTTFPFANRRGTTILDRSTAYPLFGFRAGRAVARMVSAGEHRRRARAGSQRAGLRDGRSRCGHARTTRIQSARARRIRGHRSVPRTVEAVRVLAPPHRRPPLGTIGRPCNRHRSIPRQSGDRAPGCQQGCCPRHSQRHRAG